MTNFKITNLLMTNLNMHMIFHVVVSVYWFVKIWNSPQFPDEFRNGQSNSSHPRLKFLYSCCTTVKEQICPTSCILIKLSYCCFNKMHHSDKFNCWRALARQHPILHNSKKKAQSVGCKIGGMRSRLCSLYPGIPGCLWINACRKYRSISSNSPAQLEIKDTINKVKYGGL